MFLELAVDSEKFSFEWTASSKFPKALFLVAGLIDTPIAEVLRSYYCIPNLHEALLTKVQILRRRRFVTTEMLHLNYRIIERRGNAQLYQ